MKHWTNTSGSGEASPHTDEIKHPDTKWSEQNFGLMGETVLANGWAIFPQTYNTEKREPGTPRGGRKIAYKKTLRLHQQLPSIDDVRWWADNIVGNHSGLGSLNVAGVTGDTAGGGLGWFALDIDIYDASKVAIIVAIAAEVFGYSPLRRGRGSVAKITIVYRRPAGALQVSRRWVLEAAFDGREEAIEILDDGAPTTFFGRHHGTREFFVWADLSPLNSRPDVAPIAYEELVLEFLRQVNARFSIRNFDKLIGAKAAGADIDWTDTDVSDLRVPAIAEDRLPSETLTGGRRQDWLLPRSGAWAVLNAGIVAPMGNGSRTVSATGVSLVAKAVAREATEYTTLSEGQAYARSRELVRTAAAKLADGSFKPVGTQRKAVAADGTAVVVSKDRKYPECRDAELSWLPLAKDRAKDLKGLSLSPSDADAAAARSLIKDREPIRNRVSRKVRLAIRAWIRRVSAWKPDSGKPVPRLLIKAPTGAGKTTALIQELAAFKAAGGVIGPILMLLPSYENTSELEAREDLGVRTNAQEDRAAEIVAQAGAGLRVMTFKGKIAAGCHFADIVQQLMSKRISTAGLCRSEDPSVLVEGPDGKKRPKQVFCRYNPENPDFDGGVKPCQARLQKQQVLDHDLILAPHAFIQTNIPKVLKGVAAVVIDEKIWDKCLGSYTFALEENLRRLRGNPKLTEAEKKLGVDTMEYLDDRGNLVDIALPAIREGKDVSKVILDHVQQLPGNKSRGGEILLAHTMAVTCRGQRIVLDVRPGIDPVKVEELCKSPISQGIVEEHKLWSLIDERLNAHLQDREALKVYNLHMKLYEETKPANGVDERELPEAPKLLVQHDRAHRIIYLAGADDKVTIVWRKKRNWSELPTLFLDASGRQEILEKIWGGTIRTVTVKAPLHVRTVLVPDFGQSKTSLMPSIDDSAAALLKKAELQTLNRETLYTLGLMHGDSAVVACAPKNIRQQINTNWACTGNTHFMHFGAVRGLDFAKHHGAAISIGSVTARETDIDAYVAALSYDDAEPEVLNDPHGNGRIDSDPASPKLERRYVSRPYDLRDGGTAIVDGIHEYAGRWSQMLQQQIREEELAQFVGRLRPVYRKGDAPVWYVLGRVLPEGTIVDDIISIRDLARPTGRSTRVLRTVKEQSGAVMKEGHGLYMRTYLPHSTMTAMGKLWSKLETSSRMARGFHAIDYSIEGDPILEEFTHRAYVAAASCSAEQAVELFLNAFTGGLSEGDLRDNGRPVLRGEPRLARVVRMHSFGAPKKQHEIDEMLGSLQERARREDAASRHLDQLDVHGAIDFDEKRLGFKISGRPDVIDADTFIAFEAFQTAMKKAAKECKETEAKSPSLPITPQTAGALHSGKTVRTMDGVILPVFPVQICFGITTAASDKAPAAVPIAGNDGVVFQFPRRVGVGRQQASK